MTRRPPLGALARAAAVALCLAAFACGADEPSAPAAPVTTLAEPGDVLDEPLMLALAQAKNFHHKADVYLREGEVDQAVTAIRAILAIPFPAGVPEGQDVLLDARARLGKLLLGQGDTEQALRVVEEGIAGSSRESFFLANLHTVRGEILEAIAQTTEDPALARDRRKDAIAAFDRSIAINERLQKQLAKEASP
jgi:tetratricopeptide (TPR) repeat protein